MEKGEISEEFKTGRFYGLMRENPENVWDKFMQEEKKIQVQGVQKQVSPDLIPQGDIFSSEYMEEMISQKSVDDSSEHRERMFNFAMSFKGAWGLQDRRRKVR